MDNKTKIEIAFNHIKAAIGEAPQLVGGKELSFTFRGQEVKYYPLKAWATGKSIKDGRGLQNLLNQLKAPEVKKPKKQEKTPFIPANNEQTEGINRIQNHIRTGNPNEWFCLDGKAGTGKTTIMGEALAPFMRRTIMIAALSHKAKLVLFQKLVERFGRHCVSAETIASLTGMKHDEETGRFYVDRDNKHYDPPIKRADILVIDEVSMINEEGKALIMEMKPAHCIVIVCGDIGQLPPIRPENSPYKDQPSPFFNCPNKYRLLERVRQGEDSPILPYADYFWNNSQSAAPVLYPVPDGARQSIIQPGGALVFAKSATALDACLPLYQRAIDLGNPDLIRTVVYQNKTRHAINKKIRQYLFGDRVYEQFNPGELSIFTDNWGLGKDRVSNGTEIQVNEVYPDITTEGWACFNLVTAIDGHPRHVPVLDNLAVPYFKEHLEGLAAYAQSQTGWARKKAWETFWEEKARFAPVEYGYAITSHKAQGSTYDVCLTAEADIMNVIPTSNKSKSQSIYTAITRSKYVSIILDGATDHGTAVQEAIEFYNLKQLRK